VFQLSAVSFKQGQINIKPVRNTLLVSLSVHKCTLQNVNGRYFALTLVDPGFDLGGGRGVEKFIENVDI